MNNLIQKDNANSHSQQRQHRIITREEKSPVVNNQFAQFKMCICGDDWGFLVVGGGGGKIVYFLGNIYLRRGIFQKVLYDLKSIQLITLYIQFLIKSNMKFKVSTKMPNLTAESMNEGEPSTRQQAYISRGQPNSFLEFLEQIQRNLTESGLIDDGLMVMVNINQQTGQMVMNIVKAPEIPNPNPHRPDMAVMRSALTQYQKEQEDLLSSLNSNLKKVKHDRQAYTSISRYIKHHSLSQLRLETLEQLVPTHDEEEINGKPRSMSQDTVDQHEEMQKIVSCTSLAKKAERLPQTPRSGWDERRGKDV